MRARLPLATNRVDAGRGRAVCAAIVLSWLSNETSAAREVERPRLRRPCWDGRPASLPSKRVWCRSQSWYSAGRAWCVRRAERDAQVVGEIPEDSGLGRDLAARVDDRPAGSEEHGTEARCRHRVRQAEASFQLPAATRAIRNGAPPRVMRTPATITIPPRTWPGRIGSARNRNARTTARAGTRNW